VLNHPPTDTRLLVLTFAATYPRVFRKSMPTYRSMSRFAPLLTLMFFANWMLTLPLICSSWRTPAKS